MPHRLLAVLLALPLLACTSEEEKADAQSDAWLEATCRLYVEADCLQNQQDHCGPVLSFDSVPDCVAFLSLIGASCDFDGAFLAHADQAEDCVAQVEAWDCAAEPLCNGSGDFMPDEGSCADISQAINASCDIGDTGGGFDTGA